MKIDVIRCGQTGNRAILQRMMLFVLTATLLQLFGWAVNPPPYELTPAPNAAQTAVDVGVRPPLTVEILPDIGFPVSLQKLGSVDFWIESSLIVDANGDARDIHVPSGFAITFQQRSFFESVLPRLKPKQAQLVTDELFGLIKAQIQGAKFKPRSDNATEFPMDVYVKSHFRYEGRCQKIETFIQTPRGLILNQTSIDRGDCFDF